MAIAPDLVQSITLGGYSDPLDSTLLGTYGWVVFEAGEPETLDPICERGLSLLIEQFKGKPNLEGYLCALLKTLSPVDSAFDTLKDLRKLSTATGVQLDGLGDLIGVPRNGLSDGDYREAIRFQRTVNASNGEPETLLELAKNLTEATVVKLQEQFPAGLTLYTDGSTLNTGTLSLLKKAAAAGVRLELTLSYGTDTPFAFATEGGSDPDAAGFFEPNYVPDADSGGELSEKFT